MSEKLNPQPGTQADVDLVNRAMNGDQDALLQIMNSGVAFVIEQSNPGKTIADEGTTATLIPIPEEKK
jgi:hypothetical protein